MHAGRRQRVPHGGQTSVPWRLSRSVIDSVGPAGAELALTLPSLSFKIIQSGSGFLACIIRASAGATFVSLLTGLSGSFSGQPLGASGDYELDAGLPESIDCLAVVLCTFVGDDCVDVFQLAHRCQAGHFEL
jgi:hypothetical protein